MNLLMAMNVSTVVQTASHVIQDPINVKLARKLSVLRIVFVFVKTDFSMIRISNNVKLVTQLVRLA